MKLSYRTLDSKVFMESLIKLAEAEVSNPKTLKKIANLYILITLEVKKAIEKMRSEFDDFYVKDENGNPIECKNPTISKYEVKEGRLEEYKAKLEKFLDTNVEIPEYRLSPDELISAKVSAIQAVNLMPIHDLFNS